MSNTHCSTKGCGFQIGLLSRYCDECEAKREGLHKPTPESAPTPEPVPEPKPETYKATISGPCRHCSQLTTGTSLKDLFCSAPCRVYDERRRSERNQRMNPGQVGFFPSTEHEQREHKRALMKRYGAA